MKRAISTATAVIFILVFLFGSTAPASAATLVVYASRTPGVYYTDTTLSVALTTYPGATIVYTTDGSTPSASINFWGTLSISRGTKYTGTLYLSSTRTIKALAVMRYNAPSAVASFTYELYSPTRLAEAARVKNSNFSYSAYPYNAWYAVASGSASYFTKTYTGITPGTVNCTWYTATKVMYFKNRYALFDRAGGLDGRMWYSRLVSNSSQVKYGGSGGLEALVKANNNRPVYNIVVSFERNGSYTNGHVMLIDAIINGKLYYTDSSRPGVWTVSNSIAEFKSKYSSYNGLILGVVHLK